MQIETEWIFILITDSFDDVCVCVCCASADYVMVCDAAVQEESERNKNDMSHSFGRFLSDFPVLLFLRHWKLLMFILTLRVFPFSPCRRRFSFSVAVSVPLRNCRYFRLRDFARFYLFDGCPNVELTHLFFIRKWAAVSLSKRNNIKNADVTCFVSLFALSFIHSTNTQTPPLSLYLFVTLANLFSTNAFGEWTEYWMGLSRLRLTSTLLSNVSIDIDYTFKMSWIRINWLNLLRIGSENVVARKRKRKKKERKMNIFCFGEKVVILKWCVGDCVCVRMKWRFQRAIVYRSQSSLRNYWFTIAFKWENGENGKSYWIEASQCLRVCLFVFCCVFVQ